MTHFLLIQLLWKSLNKKIHKTQTNKQKRLVNTLPQFFIPFQNKGAVTSFTIVIIAFCSCLDQNFTSRILELRLWSVQLECQAGLIPELVVKNLSPKYFQILIQNAPPSLLFPPSLSLSPFLTWTEIYPKSPLSPPQQNIGVFLNLFWQIKWVLNSTKS